MLGALFELAKGIVMLVLAVAGLIAALGAIAICAAAAVALIAALAIFAVLFFPLIVILIAVL